MAACPSAYRIPPRRAFGPSTRAASRYTRQPHDQFFKRENGEFPADTAALAAENIRLRTAAAGVRQAHGPPSGY